MPIMSNFPSASSGSAVTTSILSQHASAKVNYNFTKKLSVRSCSKLTAALYQPATLKRPISRVPVPNGTMVRSKEEEDEEGFDAAASRRGGKVSKSSDEEDVTTVDFDLNLDMSEEVIEQKTITPSSSFYRMNQYDENVASVVKGWDGNMPTTDPVQFLLDILVTRGYESNYIESATSNMVIPPSRIGRKQLEDYELDLVTAVKESDMQKLKHLYACGRSMNACNKFGESLIHLACRRSSYEIVDFLVQHNPAGLLVDDYGRTPLHDACWSPEPRFDVVALIMDRYLSLIRHRDKRGNTPLHYVRREHWHLWCAFLQSQKEIYWAPISK